MIVNWTQDRIKVIPCVDPKSGVQVGKVILQPGMQEVPDDQWKFARLHVEDQIKRKVIIEVHGKSEIVKEEIPDPADKEGKKKVEKRTVKIQSKPLKDLEPAQAIKVVEQTFSLATLGKWRKSIKSETVRHAINEQIDKIKKYGDKAKDKKEDASEIGGE